jgi:hypothetical protein
MNLSSLRHLWVLWLGLLLPFIGTAPLRSLEFQSYAG